MSAPFGRYETTVEGTHFAFNPPSENGGHEGMRFLELADADGRALTIRTAQDAHFDARHSRIADYFAARHEHELRRRPRDLPAHRRGARAHRRGHGLVHRHGPGADAGGGAHHLRFWIELR